MLTNKCFFDKDNADDDANDHHHAGKLSTMVNSVLAEIFWGWEEEAAKAAAAIAVDYYVFLGFDSHSSLNSIAE